MIYGIRVGQTVGQTVGQIVDHIRSLIASIFASDLMRPRKVRPKLTAPAPRRFSLAVSNDALVSFAEQAAWLTAITLATLIGIAQLRRDHPHDWLPRASAGFLPIARRMEPTWLDLTIRPHRDTRPAWIDTIYHGRFERPAGLIADQAVDLVVTSSPYGMLRGADYGGLPVADYPALTVAWMAEVKGILKPIGSVMIIIRPQVVNGALSDYMLRTRLALRNDGWTECDEWHWDKPGGPPLGHVEGESRLYAQYSSRLY
jgi:hypothetical protein